MKAHWQSKILYQVLPPLLLLMLASIRHGPALFAVSSVFWIVGFISILRLSYLLLHPDRPYHRIYRPLLSLVVCTLAIAHIQLSLMDARGFARQTAAAVQAKCTSEQECPMALSGWPPRHDRYSSQITRGKWVRWPILYYSDGQNFTVRLYKLFDMGEEWPGGVATSAPNNSFKPKPLRGSA